ncbi:DUF6692 family protein [Stakelama tenebrarum]|uniref:DUF6692 family protein n=1 Tax=Stakelama tenebrarum TaxID=2711215 RepID=UPI0019D1B254|nr:DUF6692 family protein [Sphingosinithalassobacter tenebrarum]
MIRLTLLVVAALPLIALGGCNRNTAPGNDREAQVDAAPSPAPRTPAAQALSGVAVAAVQPETMTDADIASLGGPEGMCSIRLTRVGLPSFVHTGLDRTGAIKLNGKLIPMRAQREGMFADDGLRVAILPLDDKFDSNGLREAEMIVMLPGAEDEIGFRGYEDCSRRIDRPVKGEARSFVSSPWPSAALGTTALIPLLAVAALLEIKTGGRPCRGRRSSRHVRRLGARH